MSINEPNALTPSAPDPGPIPATIAESGAVVGPFGQRGNPAAPSDVGAMFDRIAGTYDPINALISGFQEPRWRARLVASCRLEPGMAALDVATGTGAVARDLARRVGSGGRVVGVDISAGMLAVARRRTSASPRTSHSSGVVTYLDGNATSLPVEEASFDAATIAFGMRNLPDYERGFTEMTRAVRPGGVVACLEIARPPSLLGRIGGIWFERVVPRIGRLAGQGNAYRYLVASVQAYPPPTEIAEIMRQAGLIEVAWTPMTFGMVTLHTGRRA